MERDTFVLCMALVQGSHTGVLKVVLHCTGLCQTYPEVGALTLSIRDSFDQNKIALFVIVLGQIVPC